MTLRTRRVLFIFFILAFLIITPLVISYAAGYSFSFSGKILEKTGMLIIDSEPRGAKIYIDDEAEQAFFKKIFNQEKSYITTPAKIKNLKPGEYDIRLELDGFWEWNKKLEIKSGLSTFAEDINLFKKNLPLLLMPGKIEAISVSPNKKYLASLGNNNINIFNFENEAKISASTEGTTEPYSFTWSPNEEKLIIGTSLFDSNNLKLSLKLDEYIESDNIKWKKNSNDEIYYLSKKDGTTSINQFNLSSRAIKKIITSENIIDYLINEDQIILIKQNLETANLDIYETNSSKLLRSIELPTTLNYKFINTNNKLINLYDEKREILYLIDVNAYSPLKKRINNVKYTYWINGKLLYANDFEVWLTDINSESNTLLTRVGSKINQIIWHPNNNYIIYSTENSIYTLELDDREKRSTTELIKLDKISSLYLNPKGENLYFYAQIGKQEGLYKLTIQ